MTNNQSAILCISIFLLLGLTSLVHSADYDSRLANALTVLSQKGYISNDRVRQSNTFGSVDERAAKALESALDAFDMEAVNAIGWLNRQGLAVSWSEQSTSKADEATKASSSLTAKDRWKHILEQVYGKGGQGYVFEEDAKLNPNLNCDLAEVYRASEISGDEDGWYAMKVEIGPIGETETTIPLRLNINTGQVIEFPDSEGRETTNRQFSPLSVD